MGFLHKLWDETLAGPTPDTGLGKLRKYNSFSARSSPPVHVHVAAAANCSEEIGISRSITIIRTTGSNLKKLCLDPDSTPESPSVPATPGTPPSPGIPDGDFRRLARRKFPVGGFESAEPRSLTIYDWEVICALER